MYSVKRTTCGCDPGGIEKAAVVRPPGRHGAVVGCLPKPQLRSGPICPRVHAVVISPSPCCSTRSRTDSTLFACQFGFRRQSGACTVLPSAVFSRVGPQTTAWLGPSGVPCLSTNLPSQSTPYGFELKDRMPVPVGKSVVSTH